MEHEHINELKIKIARRKLHNKIFAIVGLIASMVGVGLMFVLYIDLAIDGAPRLSYDFFTSYPSRFPERAGILSAWVGTFLVMIVTAAAAIPLGVGAGIYLEEYARKNRLMNIIEININNLVGVPSIIYGLLALGVFVYFFNFGRSILTAGLTLGLFILPVVIVSTREAIKAIPNSVREAAYALGATKWQTVKDHIIPYSTGGILTGIILGMSRAIGDTAPLLIIGALTFIAFLPSSPISGDFPFINFDWLLSPYTVMPIQMFNWVGRPQKEFHQIAAAAGIVLLVMTLIMNAIAIYIRYKTRKKIKW
jgi:phosphate transport system permease protein